MKREITQGFQQTLLETVGEWHYVLLNDECTPIDDDWKEVKPANYEEVLRHFEQGGNLGLVPESLRFITVHAAKSVDAVISEYGTPTYQSTDPLTGEYKYCWYKTGRSGLGPLRTLFGYVHTDDWYIPVSNGDIVLLYARYLDERFETVSLRVFYGGSKQEPAALEPPDDPTPELGSKDGKAKKREIPTQFDYSFMFAADCKQELRYCDETGKWYEFDGTRWGDGRCRSVGKAMQLIIDHGQRGQQTTAFSKAVVKLAESNSLMNVHQDEFDDNATLLGLPDAVYDFDATAERNGKYSDYITLSTNSGIATRDSTIWLDFLEQFMGDYHTRQWLQLLFGQCLIGRQTEHILPFLCGTGANGKTVLMETIKHAMGSYSAHLDSENLLQSNSNRHSTDWAALSRKRLVVVDELPDNATWNMSLIKQVTGGGELTARFMHQNNFTYKPKFTLIVMSNDKPRLRTVDDSVRRRLRLIPCTNKVPEGEQDSSLPYKLRQESAGVLKWLVDGANKYVEGYMRKGHKLPVTDLIREYSETYFEVQDPISQLITDNQESIEIPFYRNEDAKVLRSTVLKLARAAMPLMRWTAPKLAAALEKQGITTCLFQGYWYYKGIDRTAYEPNYQSNILG